MCVCVYVYVYVCAYVYMCVLVHIYVLVCVFVYLFVNKVYVTPGIGGWWGGRGSTLKAEFLMLRKIRVKKIDFVFLNCRGKNCYASLPETAHLFMV